MWTVLVLYVISFQSSLGDLVVQLIDGKVQGTTIDTPIGQTFYAWRGIPFAKPPVGKLRYLPPINAEPWEGIRDASKDSPACIPFVVFPTDPVPLNGYSEDCLYINVYSPVAVNSNSSLGNICEVIIARSFTKIEVNTSVMPGNNSAAYIGFEEPLAIDVHNLFLNREYCLPTPRPQIGQLVIIPAKFDRTCKVNPNRSVIFWIYGGGFSGGFSDFGFYDPTPFLEEDVIIVTFNYRLGVFGFLSTEDEVILGNAGLKDQLLALQWVRNNIAFFGGNPQDVTIFGESAGGMSVGYHIVSPMSRNLFKGAILESGSAITDLHQLNARANALELAKKVDSSITNSSTSEQIRDVLQAASIDLITNISIGMLAPVLEVKSNLSFLTEPLYETLESGDIAKVPIIIGFNSEERIGNGNDTTPYVQQATSFDSDPSLLLATSLRLKEGASRESIGKQIHEQYVGKEGLFSENLGKYFEFLSDDIFLRSSIKHAILQSKVSPVYMYQFSYYGTASIGNILVPGAGKVGHAQELSYLFNISSKPIETEADYLTRRRFVKLWTNFAKTSNPTPDDDSAELLQNVKWETITEDHIQYLDIDENLTLKPSRKGNETIFWDYIWDTYATRPYNTY